MAATPQLGLRAGEYVRVRSKEEILRTLDKTGRLEEMPFMPEMLKYCGKRFQVGKRAHKTCDPINGLESRRLKDAVHLEDLRCDGAQHGGCQAGCLFFWKEAWLVRDGDTSDRQQPATTGGCTEAQMLAGVIAADSPVSGDDVTYVCQATQVAAATAPLKWWDLRQYVEDYRSGNAGIGRMLAALTFSAYHNLSNLGLGVGEGMRWLYDRFQKLIGGSPYPWRPGRIPKGGRTPTVSKGIQEGDFVRIKSYKEILETLDEDWRNRGLYFDAEMVPFTNGTYRVRTRVDKIIHEKTGKMLQFKSPALILDDVVCAARYAACRKLCPRGYFMYWREIWVDKVPAPAEAPCAQAASLMCSEETPACAPAAK